MKRVAFVLVIFCLCFSGIGNGKKEVCKYTENHLDWAMGERLEEGIIMIEKAAGKPVYGFF